LNSEDCIDLTPEPTLEERRLMASRREALHKLGKYSVYATPVVLGIVGQRAAHASVAINPAPAE
jgi:hypothetical protein